MNYSGIIVGLISLVIIGLWHFIVIKGEYLLGKRICILVFAIIGFIFICVSMLTDNTEISVLLALFGFSALWGIREVVEQERRVARGWFHKRSKNH